MENKNEKINIITLHRIVNYGSVLQAYSTQYILGKLGYNAELIDYYPERMHFLGMLKRIKNKNEKLRKSLLLRTIARILIIPSYLKRFYIFKKFVKEKLNTTKLTYYSEEEIQQNIPQADIYCTGSDQVWNASWNEKIDKVFFLDFVEKNKKCISYSASFGKKEIEEWEKEETKKLLEKYSYLSTREKSGVDIIEDLGINNSVQVLDPTLLLNKEEWKILISKKYENRKYIFMYNINRDKKLDNYAKKLSKIKNLKLIYVSYNFHEMFKYGKLKCNPKVEDFLSLLANAEYVLTDSFHCTAYSLNLNKNLLVSYPKKFSTRLESIVNLTEVQNKVITDYNDFSIADRKIDFNNVNKKLEEERNKSIEYLKKALKK